MKVNVTIPHRIALVAIPVVIAPFTGCRTPGEMAPIAADPADVGSHSSLVRASYEVISGPAHQPRHWGRDKTFHAKGATFVSVREEAGQRSGRRDGPEQSHRDFQIGESFDEHEVERRIERFGNVA